MVRVVSGVDGDVAICLDRLSLLVGRDRDGGSGLFRNVCGRCDDLQGSQRADDARGCGSLGRRGVVEES